MTPSQFAALRDWIMAEASIAVAIGTKDGQLVNSAIVSRNTAEQAARKAFGVDGDE